MSIIQIIKEQMNMTERERDICRYILENPEKIEEMSSRELGLSLIHISEPTRPY